MNVIEDDVFDIVKRIKEIDSDYFVVFNKQKLLFELHHASQPLTSYCLTFPFEHLDVRAVDFVQKTKRQNKDKLIKEMEEENEKLEKEKINTFKRRMYGS